VNECIFEIASAISEAQNHPAEIVINTGPIIASIAATGRKKIDEEKKRGREGRRMELQ
jgi:hypothetical protein